MSMLRGIAAVLDPNILAGNLDPHEHLSQVPVAIRR